MSNATVNDRSGAVPWWQPVLFASMAGGMGWGIRGQFGHNTGAMIAGVLVFLTLALLFCRGQKPLTLARAAAWGAIGIGIGGSMTYGQTLGLTHNPDMVGNWEALRWGMFGLLIKGGVWIGFGGMFFGMGLGGVRYRWRDMLGLMLALLGAFLIGHSLLNSPFDPAGKTLPWLYFSASWYWQPDAEALRPRPECWGGLLFALGAGLAYVGWWRKDGLALRLGLWGVLGGMIGFPAGQSLQAYHGWNRELFQQGVWAWLNPHMNWWTAMETTFGAVMGALLGLGLWLNRSRIRPPQDPDAHEFGYGAEACLLAAHLALLAPAEFLSIRAVDAVYNLGLMLAVIPLVGVAGGRFWPYAVLFPVTLMPIAGKTLRGLSYREEVLSLGAGWFVYFILPMLLASAAAVWFYRMKNTRRFLGMSLVLTTWLYFLLNHAIFRFPWPWAQWTSRTPSGIAFTICALGLTMLYVMQRRSAASEMTRSAAEFASEER